MRLSSAPSALPKPITQADLPFTTPASGKYYVVEDLTFFDGAAIIVTEDNVCIDFDCHTLTLDPIGTQGIVASNVVDLSVKNGVIKARAVSSHVGSIGISLVAVDGLTIDNMVFRNTRRGILAGTADPTSGLSNMMVSKCEFTHPASTGRGLQTLFVSDLVVKDCLFSQIGQAGIRGNGGDHNIRIEGCLFRATSSSEDLPVASEYITFDFTIHNIEISNCQIDSYAIGVNLLNCEGTIIENSLFHSSFGNLGQDQRTIGSGISRDLTVRNCTFILDQTDDATFNVSVFGVTGCLFENCIFDSNQTSSQFPFRIANLMFLSSAFCEPTIFPTVSAAKVLNCQFVNNPSTHIILEAGNSNIVIEGCTIEGGVEQSILFEGTSNSIVKDCSIVKSNGAGIVMTDGVHNKTQFFSQENLLFQNNLQGNAGAGIVLKNNSSKNTIKENVASNNGNDGIFINHTSCNNTLIANNVFNNAHNGINNDCKCHEFYDNTACNNMCKN